MSTMIDNAMPVDKCVIEQSDQTEADRDQQTVFIMLPPFFRFMDQG